MKKGKEVDVRVKMSAEMVERLDRDAGKMETSRSDLIRMIVADWMRSGKKTITPRTRV